LCGIKEESVNKNILCCNGWVDGKMGKNQSRLEMVCSLMRKNYKRTARTAPILWVISESVVQQKLVYKGKNNICFK